MRMVNGCRIQGLTGLALALSLGPLSGCEGGQTGDLSGQNDGSGTTVEVGGCDEHREKLASFDTMTDAGSANQLLAVAERSFAAPLTWKAPAEGQSWSVGPESGSGQVHVAISRGQSAYLLTYSPHESGGGGATIDIGVTCPPTQLGVEAHADVTTDGGALNESYAVMLRSSSAGVAQLSVPFDPKQVGGELEITSSNPDAKLVQLSLDATLTDAGMSGSISGFEQLALGTGPDSAVSVSPAVLAVWPDSPACQSFFPDGAGLPLPLSGEVFGVTGEATLASLTLPAQPITWLDGKQTTLSIGFAASGDACLRVRSDLPVDVGGGPSVSYPVVISLRSADGRLDGAYPGKVVVVGSAGARSVSADVSLELSVDDVDSSGFASVAVPSSADSLLLRVEETLEDGMLAGNVRLLALTAGGCGSSNPAPSSGGASMSASSPGCAAQIQTPLESAAWNP
jgi:hypothetical protein